MEDHYSSYWSAAPIEENWVQSSSTAAIYDESFSVPWTLQPDASASASATFQLHGFPSCSWSVPNQNSAAADGAAASVSKSHSQAEKRRRDRINAQLGILRKLIPRSEKMDKAALLGTVIDHVKDLKLKAIEISKNFTIPTEVDEVTVDCDACKDASSSNINKELKENALIRVSICCDDRPELFSELIQVLKSLRLSIVRADITSVGGRVKGILALYNKCSKEGGVVSLGTIKHSLNAVLSRIASSSIPSNYRIRSKRQRFFLPPY